MLINIIKSNKFYILIQNICKYLEIHDENIINSMINHYNNNITSDNQDNELINNNIISDHDKEIINNLNNIIYDEIYLFECSRLFNNYLNDFINDFDLNLKFNIFDYYLYTKKNVIEICTKEINNIDFKKFKIFSNFNYNINNGKNDITNFFEIIFFNQDYKLLFNDKYILEYNIDASCKLHFQNLFFGKPLIRIFCENSFIYSFKIFDEKENEDNYNTFNFKLGQLLLTKICDHLNYTSFIDNNNVKVSINDLRTKNKLINDMFLFGNDIVKNFKIDENKMNELYDKLLLLEQFISNNKKADLLTQIYRLKYNVSTNFCIKKHKQHEGFYTFLLVKLWNDFILQINIYVLDCRILYIPYNIVMNYQRKYGYYCINNHIFTPLNIQLTDLMNKQFENSYFFETFINTNRNKHNYEGNDLVYCDNEIYLTNKFILIFRLISKSILEEINKKIYISTIENYISLDIKQIIQEYLDNNKINSKIENLIFTDNTLFHNMLIYSNDELEEIIKTKLQHENYKKLVKLNDRLHHNFIIILNNTYNQIEYSLLQILFDIYE